MTINILKYNKLYKFTFENVHYSDFKPNNSQINR